MKSGRTTEVRDLVVENVSQKPMFEIVKMEYCECMMRDFNVCIRVLR